MTDVLTPEQEYDFSGDSAVEVVEAVWTITEAEVKETSSGNGTGKQHILTFESPDFPFAIPIRFFVEYKPTDPTKDTKWVSRQRGVLKNIAKVALDNGGQYSLNPESPNYIVGKQVKATTKDNGEGFPTLSRFRKAD